MKRLLPKLVICLLMLLVIAISADDQRGFIKIKDKAGTEVGLYENSYALLIGVSKYTNGWPSLPGVKNDIPLVKAALEKQGFTVTVAEDPTYKQLQEAFVEFIFKNGQEPNDRLLLYFSGHGHTMKLSYGGEMGYIVPTDAPNPNIDPTGFFSKAMDMQQIEVYAKRVQSKHALFMFDSCFSGSIFDITRAVPENISYKTARPVRQIITAGAADEAVPDKSIFRQQFIEALDGEGDTDKDGYITGVELGEFLQKRVINYSKDAQHPQYGKIRDPLLDKGDFVFQMTKSEPLSAPPSGRGFSLDDLKNEADRLEAVEKVEKAWVTRLDEMKKAYNEVKAIEARDIAPNLKVTAWQRFIDSFKEDDPYSQEDDTMRSEASRQLDHWKNQLPDESTRPSNTNQPKEITGKDGAPMVLIPAGEFQMGSKDNNDNYDNEKPVHTVYLDAFYIDKYEVTNAQYKKFMDATGHESPYEWNEVKFRVSGKLVSFNAPDQPVVCVSWEDAASYADWAGKRLPTEAEWEKAARGGLVGMKYPWGDTLTHDNANYDGTGGKDIWDGVSPVGSFAPNGYGLYDMVGNVMEWCSDWYDKEYYTNSPRQNPKGPGSGTFRVTRGGSWNYYSICYSLYDPLSLRVASRSLISVPTRSGYNAGFRCVVNQMEARESYAANTSINTKGYDDYVGRYDYGTNGVILNVTREGDKLFAQMSAQPKYEIFPKSDRVFFWKVVDAQIEFVKNESGEITHAIHCQGGVEIKATKVKETSVKVDPAIYDAYVGQYDFRQDILTITKEDNRLFAQMTGQPKFEIFPRSKTEFFFKVVTASITFVKDDKGKVIKMILNQGDIKLEALKK